MKKSLLLAVSLLFSLTTIFAQRVTVPEPEFADQTYLLTSDTLTNYCHERQVSLKRKLALRYI